jgi:hypothetical protein
VLLGVADGDVAQYEAVGAIGADADILDGTGRSMIARGHPPGVDHHIVGAHARSFDLQVAANAGSAAGNPVSIGQRRLRILSTDRPANHGDQILVVGAVDLVGV